MIRQLKPGEPVPSGTPKRYRSSHGYVRLRWRVGPKQWVEAYEHRIVSGVVTSDHVHHVNGDKADNRPDNLEVKTASRHIREHCPIGWDVQEAWKLYSEGFSLPALSSRYGVHHVTILRAFRSRGYDLRPPSGEWRRTPVNYDLVRDLHSKGMRVAEMARHLEVGRAVIARVCAELGLKPFPKGRPAGVPNYDI